MKILISLLSLVLLCGCGCVTPPQITAGKLQGLSYRQSFQEVQKQLGGEGEGWFKILQTNTVYECRMVYTHDSNKSYFLLFKDGSLISLIDSEKSKSKWWGFSNLTQPDFSEVNLLLVGFFPPEPLSNFQFTNYINTVQNRNERNENLQTTIELAPFLIPTAVVMPLMMHQSNKLVNWFGKIDSLNTGESEAEIVQLLGEPKQKIGSSEQSIWTYIYQGWSVSFGIENGKLVWIMHGYNPR